MTSKSRSMPHPYGRRRKGVSSTDQKTNAIIITDTIEGLKKSKT